MKQSIVISPQSGFGNRLRAISGAMVLARQTNRDIFHAWYPIVPNDPRPHVTPLQIIGFDEFFLPTDALPRINRDIAFDLAFSEWAPGDRCYPWQSNVQREFGLPIVKTPNPADQIANSDASTILVETSHRVRLDAAHGGYATTREFASALTDAYRALVPRPEYLERLKRARPVDVGIAIRRGDMLLFSAAANQSLDDIRAWVLEIAKEKSVAIFSDDPAARRFVQEALPGYRADPVFEDALFNAPPQVAAFLQFLYLARQCRVVCGTPDSSFAGEAAIYGGKRYVQILGKMPG